ncbi:MAG: GNAT family N-acetyltransferase [Methanobrevibacter sp.]|nr:GNAT family N-acetyltransferase [Methanobrevibacter sp.]
MVSHIGTQTIETDRLILRKFKYEDNQDMLDYWISDSNIQFLYYEPIYASYDEVKKLLDNYISSYENMDYYRWAIIEEDSNFCIGQIAFFLMDTDNHFGEIEFCIGTKFQKRGYGTEATKAIIDFGFNQIDLHKIQICHDENNLASKSLIEKCNLRYEGTLRDYFFVNGKYLDRLYYSILKEEYIL